MTRFEVWTVELDPTVGSEIGKTRPAIIVSPDVVSRKLRTVIVAPLTSTLPGWPTRVQVRVRRRAGEAALDQLRAVDRSRLRLKVATLTADESKEIADRLVEMFQL